MSSPFATYEEFAGAIDGPMEGAIYTFAHAPIVNIMALLVGVGLFIWFLGRTFTSHYDLPISDKALSHLSTFIVAGLLSLAGLGYRPTPPGQPVETRAEALSHRPKAASALGLLGLVGVGWPMGQRRSKARKGLYRSIKSRP